MKHTREKLFWIHNFSHAYNLVNNGETNDDEGEEKENEEELIGRAYETSELTEVEEKEIKEAFFEANLPNYKKKEHSFEEYGIDKVSE